ncbi:mediator of RNA polymerase II transcription subunit 8 [Diaphorina citri]|uniref:Mediator of RNA polymerase II transcription subunit 8 n=1 Tax=Diaphorina citri TaxID=121845 RepID=A0A1S3D4D4_DIACI|nr:mediator of RNA polymerase II transcription subunit 8 [Diaphorina citri]KAI5737624.1 hypothetical protein M8J76_015140 [Diaphorina citri]
MQREEKQLESSLESVVMKLNEIKSQLVGMLFKIDHDRDSLNWPTFLDNFALLSGQFSAIAKVLSHDKTPPIRNLTVLPLILNPEREEELLRLTEGRVPAFTHDLVPDYLRTKQEPDVEHKLIQLEHKAASLSYDAAQKQAATFNKVITHVLDIVSKAREEWESEAGARGGTGQTSSLTDTHSLVAAVGMGRGLKMIMPGPGAPVGPGMMVAPGGPGRPVGPGPGMPMGPGGQPMGMMGKNPSGIKTNIKAAAAIHPYSR